MIDVTSESLAPLSKAAREWVPSIRGNKPANPCTLWRWIHRGCRGVHLEHVQAGGVVMTSREAIVRFFSRLTNGDTPPPARTKALEREHAKAKAELAAIGI